MQLPGLNTDWLLLVDVPTSVVADEVFSEVAIQVISGVLVLLAVLTTLLLAVRFIVKKPIASIIRDVKELSEKRYDNEVAGQNRPTRSMPSSTAVITASKSCLSSASFNGCAAGACHRFWNSPGSSWRS